jgi:hypothetical protein
MLGFPLGILSAAGAGGVAVASDYELISTTLIASNTPSVTFSSLGTYSSTYKHLQIRATARSSRADTADQHSIRLNGDTGSNYAWHYMESRTGTSTVGSDGAGSQTDIFGSWLPAASATSNAFGAFVLDILDPYSTSKNKTIRMLNGAQTFNVISLGSGFRNNTESLTSITIGSRLSSNYVAGSRFSIYGIKG